VWQLGSEAHGLLALDHNPALDGLTVELTASQRARGAAIPNMAPVRLYRSRRIARSGGNRLNLAIQAEQMSGAGLKPRHIQNCRREGVIEVENHWRISP
jgi:hypothetical protein